MSGRIATCSGISPGHAGSVGGRHWYLDCRWRCSNSAFLPSAWPIPADSYPRKRLLIGIPLYLVVPAIAGYWRYRQGQHEGWESGWAGFRVGFVGFAVFVLAVALIFTAIFMRYINYASYLHATITPSVGAI